VTAPGRQPADQPGAGGDRAFVHNDLAAVRTSPGRAPRSIQFSLKSLFLLVLASALLAGAWSAAGASLAAVVFMGLLLTIPVLWPGSSWKRAYLVACGVVYGPFVVMTAWTLLFVDCTHCKETACRLLPCSPGIVPVELACRWLGLPRLSDELGFGVAFAATALLLWAMSWMVRRGGWWLSLGAAAVMLPCSYCAIAILALIRA
jgi:hypothetical protein